MQDMLMLTLQTIKFILSANSCSMKLYFLFQSCRMARAFKVRFCLHSTLTSHLVTRPHRADSCLRLLCWGKSLLPLLLTLRTSLLGKKETRHAVWAEPDLHIVFWTPDSKIKHLKNPPLAASSNCSSRRLIFCPFGPKGTLPSLTT